jgi:hypothetical protein
VTLLPSPPETNPSVRAAVLLFAREVLEDRPWPGTVAEVLAVTGAGRSQAYAMLPRLREAAATLVAPTGRPDTAPSETATVAVLQAVRDFLMEHPGAVTGHGARRSYSDGFRRLVTGLMAPRAVACSLTVEQFADAAGVAVGTLKDWLRLPAAPAVEEPAVAPAFDSARPDIAAILALWPKWEGSFQDFCRMLRQEHRLAVGDTFVGNVLQAAGLRHRKPRGQGQAPWSKDTWRTLFPGAQWLGDGTTVALSLDGVWHVFNIEVVSDPATNATVGVDVSDTEDAAAVLAAFEHGKQTTGEAPLAMTLDNKAPNLSAEVKEGIAPAELLRATPGRGQAKAPLEGSFGLFRQTAPPLVVSGRTPRERARSYLELLFVTWAWARNGKPRRKLGGRSPAEAHAQNRPTEEELAKAKAWLAELRRREEQARKTRAQKADPVRRAVLEAAIAELGIPDPNGHLAPSLARYGIDAILRAIAVFRARLERGTLPPDAERGRYLAGIVRNLDTRLDLERMADHLLEIRLRHGDLTLAALDRELRDLRAKTPPAHHVAAIVDRALIADASIDFRFWTRAAAGTLAGLANAAAHHRDLARRIAASFNTDRDRRADLIDALARAAAQTAETVPQQRCA